MSADHSHNHKHGKCGESADDHAFDHETCKGDHKHTETHDHSHAHSGEAHGHSDCVKQDVFGHHDEHRTHAEKHQNVHHDNHSVPVTVGHKHDKPVHKEGDEHGHSHAHHGAVFEDKH